MVSKKSERKAARKAKVQGKARVNHKGEKQHAKKNKELTESVKKKVKSIRDKGKTILPGAVIIRPSVGVVSTRGARHDARGRPSSGNVRIHGAGITQKAPHPKKAKVKKNTPPTRKKTSSQVAKPKSINKHLS